MYFGFLNHRIYVASPLPALPSPEKVSTVFAALCLQAFGTANGESASLFPLLAQSLRRHSCLLFSTIAHHEAGERWYALTRYTLIGFLRCKNGRIYCHRFCLGIVLAHALLLILGKASHKFFEVVDSVNCLDSESSELVSKILLL